MVEGAATDAEFWKAIARLVERLGDPCLDQAREALEDLDTYLLVSKRSVYDVADRIRQRPDPWGARVTAENAEDVFAFPLAPGARAP